MLKREFIYTVFLLVTLVAFMTAGCATQDVVKKDEVIVPASVAKKADEPKSNVTAPNPAVTTPASKVFSATVPTTDKQTQKAFITSQLQTDLNMIYFDFDSARLSEAARSTLAKNAAALMKEASLKIRIEGNCDDRGSAEYNLALGERRAKSAQQYLITLGIKADRLSTISYGKEKPAVHGSDEAAMAKNRRDEFVVMTK